MYTLILSLRLIRDRDRKGESEGARTLTVKTLRIVTFCVMTLCVKAYYAILGINDTQHN